MSSENTDRAEQVKTLEKLLAVAATTYQRIRVILALMSARFDYNPSATHMPIDIWSAAQKEFDHFVMILVKEPEYSVQEVVGEEYDESVERAPESEPGGVVRIRGSVISFIDRLDDEFTRSLQNIDPHGTEYIERLRDEKSLYQSICHAQCFFEKSNQEDPLARVISRRLEHIYSKVSSSAKLNRPC
jgi:translation initiation factor 3 subunit C